MYNQQNTSNNNQGGFNKKNQNVKVSQNPANQANQAKAPKQQFRGSRAGPS